MAQQLSANRGDRLTEMRASRYLLWLVLALPGVVFTVRYGSGQLFYGEMVHLSGEWSVRLLLVTMAATPLALMFPGRRWTRWLLRNRRYFGVASFAYAALHTWVYADRTGDLTAIVSEAVDLEYLSGWLAGIIFLVLALTSNDASMRYLRQAWKRLHRFVYLAAALTFAHWLLVAFNPLPAMLHLSLLVGLESYRVWRVTALRRRLD